MLKVFLTFFLIFLAACSKFSAPTNDGSDGPGSIITGKNKQGLSLLNLGDTMSNSTSNNMPVNALLWRASLDIASSLPLDDVDTFGGTIVTEWYQLNEKSGERIKLAIFVLDRELRSDGIRVVVYVQKRDGNEWRDEGLDSEMGARLEELILTRAREIRAATISETN